MGEKSRNGQRASLRSRLAELERALAEEEARHGASIAAGGNATISGRLYPALADGASVRLHYFYDGRWRSRGVTTTRRSENLPGGYTARYSLYSETVSPVKTTRYYFSSGKIKSPVTTIKVK